MPAPGAGVTLAGTFAQARSMLRLAAVGDRVGVIAHSWGALVLAAAYADDAVVGALPGIGEGLLINPVALTKPEWDSAFAALLGRATPAAINAFIGLIAAGEGPQAMHVALPFYTRRGYAVPIEPFPLSAATYSAITAALGDFDYSVGAPSLARTTLIHGADDFTALDLLGAYRAACLGTTEIAAGHFPFFEAPDEFAALLGGFFR
jgi:pimeloyl-ACP methyl ester carboxylesterase